MALVTKQDREAHAERMRRYWASRTPEQRAEYGRLSREGIIRATTPELRREIARKASLTALARTTREQRREMGRQVYALTVRRLAERMDPDHVLPEDERLRQAEHERKRQLADARLAALRKRQERA